MLPKVASFSSLAAAAGSKGQLAKPATTARPARARQSFDAGNRSRAVSSQDLPSLAQDGRPPSRPSTPLPQLLAIPAEDQDVFAANVDASLLASPFSAVDGSWAALADAAAASVPEACAQANPAEHGTQLDAAILTPTADVPAAATAATDAPPALPAVKPVKAPALDVSRTPEPPCVDVLRVYHATLSLSAVQELLGNLKHVQHMFRGLLSATSSTGASAAMAAARMLARALNRAATRVKGTVKEPSLVTVARNGMLTLVEYGWVEVMTQDEEAAKALGATELEVHCLVTGSTASYHRGAVDQPWMQIGAASPSAAAGSFHAFAASPPPASPPSSPPAACTLKDGTDSPRLSSLLTSVGPSLTLEGLAEHLQAAGASVLSAANLVQAWLDEQKAAAATAVGALVGDAGNVAGTPGRVMVAAGAV